MFKGHGRSQGMYYMYLNECFNNISYDSNNLWKQYSIGHGDKSLLFRY